MLYPWMLTMAGGGWKKREEERLQLQNDIHLRLSSSHSHSIRERVFSRRCGWSGVGEYYGNRWRYHKSVCRTKRKEKLSSSAADSRCFRRGKHVQVQNLPIWSKASKWIWHLTKVWWKFVLHNSSCPACKLPQKGFFLPSLLFSSCKS